MATQIAGTGETDRLNADFWDELCGTTLARSLGIADALPASLARFDRAYFSFYPYLARHVPFADVAGRRVLEVGLGYGSVAQRLAQAGARYSGLDIAAGPVAMVRHRLAQIGQAGEVRQGSVLSAPFPDASFDAVVAIGCYHHTGNMAQALRETHRLLVPGGRASIMVYNAFSYRRWLRAPIATLRHRLRKSPAALASARQRGWYDANLAGEPAPVTEFVSIAELRRLAR